MELGKLEHVFHLLPPYNPVTCSLVPLRRLLLQLDPLLKDIHQFMKDGILTCSITPDSSKLWIHISSLQELNHGFCTICGEDLPRL